MCKFTPLGFETKGYERSLADDFRVNLPRWGLKQELSKLTATINKSVNLPRWGLKLHRRRGRKKRT